MQQNSVTEAPQKLLVSTKWSNMSLLAWRTSHSCRFLGMSYYSWLINLPLNMLIHIIKICKPCREIYWFLCAGTFRSRGGLGKQKLPWGSHSPSWYGYITKEIIWGAHEKFWGIIIIFYKFNTMFSSPFLHQIFWKFSNATFCRSCRLYKWLT